MLPVVVPPDVELWLTGWLRDVLAERAEAVAAAVTVGTVLGNPRPVKAVTVALDGGPALDVARSVARVRLNVWAGTERDANDLARLVYALVVACPDGNPVLSARGVLRPIAVPDPSGQPHRLTTVELTVRGTQA